jgi:hypothetical protein
LALQLPSLTQAADALEVFAEIGSATANNDRRTTKCVFVRRHRLLYIAALMQAQSGRRMNTFIIGFNEESYSEVVLDKSANVLTSGSLDAFYLGLVSYWDDPVCLVICGAEPPTLLTGNAPAPFGSDDIQRMIAQGALNCLSDDILVKLIRTGMGV